MVVNHAETQAGICNMSRSQHDNHYQQFYRDMCDFIDYQYGDQEGAWYRGLYLKPRSDHRQQRGCRGCGH